MKKIIFSFCCFLFSIYLVDAKILGSENLPYYVKIIYGSKEEVVNVKKIFDQETLKVVFNIDYHNYDNNHTFEKHQDYNYNIWKKNQAVINFFNTIVYYGYNVEPTDLNYFLTQVFIWKYISNFNVIITDEFGNEITDYKKEYDNIHESVLNHNSQATFFVYKQEKEIWTTEKFSYAKINQILDNPKTDDFELTTDNLDLYIYPKKVGNYKLNFFKKYEQESYCYTDGINIFWQSLKGPGNLSFNLNYNVYGTKLNIEEKIVSINNRIGDAIIDSTYELYMDNDLKLTINDLENIYVKSNSRYTLKDISDNKGINNIENIIFDVKDEEYTLIINKYLISKNISFDIKTDKTYYIYLKSSDELYETVNSSTDLITLPYGLYYIKDENNDYYKEIIIEDDKDELIVIEEKIEIKEDFEELPKEEIIDKLEDVNKEVSEEDIEEVKSEIEESVIENNIQNPKTFDNINYYIFSFVISLATITIIFKKIVQVH